MVIYDIGGFMDTYLVRKLFKTLTLPIIPFPSSSIPSPFLSLPLEVGPLIQLGVWGAL